MTAKPAVVVTGASRGQGAEHARALAESGYSIYITDVLDEEGEQIAQGLRAEGHDVVFRHLDVSDEKGWAACSDELRASDLQLKGLVNNAGVLRYASITELSLDSWRLQERVNVHGTFLGIQTLAPLMSSGGSIVNVASTSAYRGAPGYAAYSATKAAVIALTRVAAVELAPDIRVNAISPGGVSTRMNDDEPHGGSSSSAPLMRRATPDEISPLVGYLISDSSAFVTGSIFTIDGGLTAI